MYIGPKLRTERPRKTKIGTEVAHVTRDSDTTFKVKGQGHQAALLFTYLTCKAVAAVSVGMYLAWESIARRCAAGGRRGGGGILCRHVHSLLLFFSDRCPTFQHSLS